MILVVLFIYQTTATWPGLIIVLTGVPVYFIWQEACAATTESGLRESNERIDVCTIINSS